MPGIDETIDQRKARLNDMSNGVRAGLSAAATDIMGALMESGAPDIPAVMMTGAAIFVAETYEGIARASKADQAKLREHMLATTAEAFDKYAALPDEPANDEA